MRLTICGSRGSTPSPGPEFVRYGGNTSCVALAHEGCAPALLLDAGTGTQRVTRLLGGAPFRGTILLSHLHWDHTHGIPFFRAATRPDATTRVLMPSDGDAEELISRAIGPPHFPVLPSQLEGSWRFDSLEPCVLDVGGFLVEVREIPHVGGRTYGFRVSDGISTIAYITDHGPLALGPGPDGYGPYHEAAVELARDADVLIHDAQHTPAEFASLSHFGHSTPEYAAGLAREAGARALLLYHHDPSHDDAQIDAIARRVRTRGVEIAAAAEGLEVRLPRRLRVSAGGAVSAAASGPRGLRRP